LHIIAVGLNHETATVELRERISISDVDLEDALAQLRGTSTVLESVVLSTCNRTEIYAVVSSYKAGEDYLKLLLARRAGVERQEMESHLYVLHGETAVTHLFAVACGMNSLVMGETQILGQVRGAFLTAEDAGNTGLLLNRLFRLALQVGKRAQSETDIGKNAVSVSYAAVQLAKKIYGSLGGQHVLVLGAGKMSALTAQYLQNNGVDKITVINRTLTKAEELAQQFQGEAAHWTDLSQLLREADIVISSTASKGYVLSAAELATAVETRSHRPMVVIDIAVPRDVQPEAGKLRNVYLYDIDDLQGVVSANLEERERESRMVLHIIEKALREYSTWLSEQEVVPLITAIRDKGVRIQSEVMASLQRKLPNLSDKELKLIHKHTMSIVNQLLRDPVKNIKELGCEPGAAQQIHVFAQLFGISPEALLRAADGNFLAQSSGSLSQAANPANHAFADMVRRWRSTGNEQTAAALHPVLR